MEDSIFLPIISIEAIALGLGAIVLFVIGLQFKRGKWLRFIAGNTFATDDELKSPEQKKLGKRLGIVMHIRIHLPLCIDRVDDLENISGVSGD